MKKEILLIVLVLIALSGFSQKQKKKQKKAQWGLTAELGLNTSSSTSKYSQFLAPNYSIGLIRTSLKERTLIQSYQIKFNAFTESYKGIPYYYLENNVLQSGKIKQRTTNLMLYLGWLPKYYLNESQYLQAGIGFNFILISHYKRKLDGETSRLSLIMPPNNFFFTRPELSLGYGFDFKLKNSRISLAPRLVYNFTFKNLNLIPSFYSIRLESTYHF